MGAKQSAKLSPHESNSSMDHDVPRKYDPSFHGPIKDRSCTDVICCILFAVFILAFLIIGLYAFAMGDPRYLIYPVDSEGNVCGSGQLGDKPYLFYFDFVKCFVGKAGTSFDIQNLLSFGCPTPQICVHECPHKYWTFVSDDYQSAFCRYNVTPTSNDDLKEKVKMEACAAYYLNSTPVVYRCVPSLIGALLTNDGQIYSSNNKSVVMDQSQSSVSNNSVKDAVTQLVKLLNLQDYGMKILGDVTNSWWMILIFVTIAMFLSFLWIVVMRWIAGVMVLLSILLFVGFFAFAIYYCFNMYVLLKDQPHSQDPVIFTTNFEYYTNLYQTWLALGIISVIILVVVLLILLTLITRIRIAIALIKEASRAIGHMFSVLFWPLVPYLLQLIVLAYWGATAICLAAASRGNFCNITSYAGDNSTVDNPYSEARCSVQQHFFNYIPCNVSASGLSGSICNFVRNGGAKYTYVLQAFQLFMWLWLMNFIIALGQVTLAGSFASYYWAFNKPTDIPSLPLLSSLGRALRYHIGSMAFGALIIAIIQFVRMILEYIDRKLKGRESLIARFVLRCCICCLWCLEKFMKFINKNAYIMIAIYGKNFCRSAANAFQLLVRNFVRAIVLDRVADFLLFISKLFVVGAVGVFAYFFFSRRIPGVNDIIRDPQLNYYLIPVIIIIVATYIIASGFFNVYSMGVDTLFLCFLEDLERNDGSAERPYYMSKELMRILGKRNIPPGEKKKGCCC